MEEDVIRKYFCNFCKNKGNKECECKLQKEKDHNVNIYRCKNYCLDIKKIKRVENFNYTIKSNKGEKNENRNTITM